MENTNTKNNTDTIYNKETINNNETKPKRTYSKAQIRAVKAFRERNRDSEEYKINKWQIQNDHMKRIEKR